MQKTEKSRAYILPAFILLASAFVLTATAAFAPTAGATAAPCTLTWTMPAGTYAPGAPITGTVTICPGQAPGVGAWSILSEPGGITVASGTFSCTSTTCSGGVYTAPVGSPLTLFSYTAGSSPLTPGTYQVAAYYNGANFTFGFTVEQFIITNILPFGTIAAAGVSLVGLLAVRRLSKTFSITTPTA